MKKLVLSIAICILSAQGNAQWVTGGPEIGLNFSNLSTVSDGINGNNGIREGLKIGGVIDIGLSRHLALEPGLFYSAKGSHEDYISSSSNFDNTIVTTTEDKYDYRIDYLEIPINLKVKQGPFILGGGPYIAYAMGGMATADHITTVTNGNNGAAAITDKRSSYNLQVGDNANADDVRAADMGINLNVGLQSHMGLFVKANWGLGLTNIMPGGDANNYMHNNTFTISAGYLFGH